MSGRTSDGGAERSPGDRRAVRRDGPARTSPPPSTNGQLTRLTIPSTNLAVREVQDQILEYVVRHGYDDQSHFAIKLALEEALINAIKHGNKGDATKRVHVEYRVTADRLEVSVEDEGPGFERAAVPDPTLEENIEKCSGRGILLIEAYMTSVGWSHGGRRMTMVKVNDPAAVGGA